MKDEGIPDEIWWDATYAEFEDFVGIGEKRAEKLSKFLVKRGEIQASNRLLHANGLPHGFTNSAEIPNCVCYVPEKR